MSVEQNSEFTFDSRYRIKSESCGYPTPRKVVRFCGQYIDQSKTELGAKEIAQAHHEERMANL